MKSYKFIKSISRYLIVFAVFATATSAMVFAVQNNQVGADTTTGVNSAATSGTSSTGVSSGKDSSDAKKTISATPNYKVVKSSSGTSAKMVLVSVTNEEITGADYTNSTTSYGITKSKDSATCENILSLDEYCYILTYNQEWIKPSVIDPISPSWIFLEEIKGRATTASDSSSLTIINNAEASFASTALQKWDGVDLSQISQGDGQIIIRSEAFFDALDADKLTSTGSYVTYSAPQDKKTSSGTTSKQLIVKLAPAYPDAKAESLWMDAIDFTLGSVIIPWQETFHVDLSDKKLALENHRKAYANYADVASSKTDVNGTALKISGPQKIIIGTDGSAKTDGGFSVTIDPTKFTKPERGYKTQVYIKPTVKNGDAVFTYLQSTDPAATSFPFTWSAIATNPYATSILADGSVKTYDDSEIKANGIMSYEKNYPQSYTVTAITYNQDDSEKERVVMTFDTIGDSSFTEAPKVGSGNITNGHISISVPQNTFTKADRQPVHYTIQLADTNNPKKMKKIVVWTCGGTASATIAGDSSNCVGTGNIEQTIAAFIMSDIRPADKPTWKELAYDENGEATLQGDWDISGTNVGTFSLMAKAHSANSDDSGGMASYVPGSKVAVTVSITDSKLNDGGGLDTKFTDLLKLGKKASSNARGSSITDLTGAATRVVNIILSALSAICVLAIIIGGIQYISSGGDPAKAEKGKKTVIYAVYGIVLAILGFFIEYVVIDLIHQILK